MIVISASFLPGSRTESKNRKGYRRRNSETSGPKLYQSHCASCHGRDAQGEGTGCVILKDSAADLTQLAKNNGGKFPGDHVMNILLNESMSRAHGTKDMPIWGPVFTRMGKDENVGTLRAHNLMDYLKSIQVK